MTPDAVLVHADRVMPPTRILGERDAAILIDVARHRFLASDHLRRLHFHDHASQASASRSCNRVLNRLLELGLVYALPQRKGGQQRGSSALVWCLGPRGERLMRLTRGRVSRRYVTPSTEFLAHTLAIAEAHVQLVEAGRTGAYELLDVKLDAEAWRDHLGMVGGTGALRPDMYVVTAGVEDEVHRFVEIDRATENATRIRRKCLVYQRHYESGAEQARLEGTFPFVMWVVPNQRRADLIARTIKDERTLTPALFQVVTNRGFIDRIIGDLAIEGDSSGP